LFTYCILQRGKCNAPQYAPQIHLKQFVCCIGHLYY